MKFWGNLRGNLISLICGMSEHKNKLRSCYSKPHTKEVWETLQGDHKINIAMCIVRKINTLCSINM